MADNVTGGGPNWAEIATAIVAATAAIGGLGSRYLYSILDAKISKKSEELHRRIDEQRSELVADMHKALVEESRLYGDSIEAVRMHTVQVELFIRDNFVRRDEFQTSMLQLARSIDGMRESVDEKLERIRVSIDAKIDKMGSMAPR